jgi:hypothetical protein
MPEYLPHPASFRDPSGFMFRRGGTWYRQINASYAQHYGQLMQSGLYGELTGHGLLLPHDEIEQNLTGSPDWFRTLLPEQLSFISYPEEWSPAQLKEAALCTLTITRNAVAHGMILKDATPRNIQFPAGRAVLIDSLSFERHDPTLPWVAYRQFCECFLYPLYLHHYHGYGTHQTIIAWPNGIPAGIVSKLLPPRSRRSLGIWLHVRLPARIHKSGKPAGPAPLFDKNKLLHLLSNLESIVRGLRTTSSTPGGWSEYYDKTILSQTYLQEKEKLVREWISPLTFSSALDLGANEGHFSRILAEKGGRIIAAEADWKCVQAMHLSATPHLHPVCVDVTNPTPSSGFHHRERTSFTERAGSELVLALALVHHLVLGQNIPLPLIAAWLADLTRTWLIIEFVPLTDDKSKEMLRNKSSYPGPYDQPAFETQFGAWFTIQYRTVIPGTERILYLLRKKAATT